MPSTLGPRIVIMGAGAGGLTCAIALKQKYGYTNFVIYEKLHGVGGTWRSNIYPGCSSDITMPIYCLSTELRNWTASHLPQTELLAYWVELAQKHGINPHIVFNRLVISVEWNQEAQLYDIILEDTLTKERTESTAHILISAVGVLERPRHVSLPGMKSFKGDTFHSARWDYSKDLSGKRVGVVGNGSSATQFVPKLLEDPSTHIIQFCRTQMWILPNIMYKPYSRFRRNLFKWFPFLMRISRWAHFIVFENMYMIIFSNPLTRWIATKLSKLYMTTVAPSKYHNVIIPSYTLGCKRIVFDSGYLKALNLSNIQLNYDGIEAVTSDGIITKTGEKILLDVIIFATGYAADSYRISIKGSSDNTIQKYFEDQGGPKAYLGTVVPGFPNFFFICGPNVTTGHTSVVWSNEVQVNYVMQLIQPIIEAGAVSIEVTKAATDAYDAKIQKRLKNTVHMDCHSWYRVGGTGKISNIFPGSSSLFYMWLRKPNWRHFSGIGVEPWIKEKRQAERLNSLAFWALTASLAAGIYEYVLRGTESAQLLKGWIDARVSYLL